MQYKMPDFDTLKQLAEDNPAALEQLRADMVEGVIKEAPESIRRRLRGIQFQVDAYRQLANSPMAACVHLSQLMHESFGELRHALNDLAKHRAGQVIDDTGYAQSKVQSNAQILPFRQQAKC